MSIVYLLEAGYGVPSSNLDGSTATGKLGTLTTVDLTTCPALITTSSLWTSFAKFIKSFTTAGKDDALAMH
jgi:hypothetical protein